MSVVEGISRDQANLLPPCVHDYIDADALVRVVDAFATSLNLLDLRCTVQHPFGTFKRMLRGGRFLTRELRAVKAEAALSILAFNIFHAANTFGARGITPN